MDSHAVNYGIGQESVTKRAFLVQKVTPSLHFLTKVFVTSVGGGLNLALPKQLTEETTMKTDLLKLTEENVASYNDVMASPAMQKILAGTLAAEKARKAAEEEWLDKRRQMAKEELDAEFAEDMRRMARREEAIANGWGE